MPQDRHAGEGRHPRLSFHKEECAFLKKSAQKTFASFYTGFCRVPGPVGWVERKRNPSLSARHASLVP